jgi:hypothetical protein
LVDVRSGARPVIEGNILTADSGPGITGIGNGELPRLLKTNAVDVRQVRSPGARGGRP